REHLLSGFRLADDLDVLVVRQPCADRLQHQSVVVHDQNLDPPHWIAPPSCILRPLSLPADNVGRCETTGKSRGLRLALWRPRMPKGPGGCLRSLSISHESARMSMTTFVLFLCTGSALIA